MDRTEQIRVVVFKDGDQWVAQCLEFDICAQAPDLDQLRSRLMLTLQLDQQASLERHGKPFAGIDPAPRHYHEMWERRSGAYTPARPIAISGDGIDIDMAMVA